MLLVILITAVVFILTFYYLFPAVATIVKSLVSVLLPFVGGALLAAIIDPIVNFLQLRFHFPRTLATLATLLLLLFLVTWGIFILISSLVAEIQSLVSNLPLQAQNFAFIFQEFLNRLQQLYPFKDSSPPGFYETFQSALNNTALTAREVLVRALKALSVFLSSLPEMFIMLLITLVSAFFFSRDKNLVLENFYLIIPRRYRERALKILETFSRAVIGFLRAEIFLISLQTAQCIIGLLLLRVNYALVFAFLIGLSDFLPIIGPGAVFIPWIAIELITGHYSLGIALLVLYGSVITLRQILQPKLVAVNLGLYPLTTLIALYTGLKLLGVVGLALGPLTVVIFKTILASQSTSRDD